MAIKSETKFVTKSADKVGDYEAAVIKAAVARKAEAVKNGPKVWLRA